MAELPRRRRLADLTASDVAPLEAAFDPRYPARLREMATVLHMVLVDEGAAPDRAPQLAIALTDALSIELGGGGFYMHKGHVFRQRKELDNRDAQIRAEYRGWNTAVLARKFGLTEMRIRQICGDSDEVKAGRRERHEAFQQAQNPLFDDQQG